MNCPSSSFNLELLDDVLFASDGRATVSRHPTLLTHVSNPIVRIVSLENGNPAEIFTGVLPRNVWLAPS